MTGTRVSVLPTAAAPGTFYVIEGGVSKKIVLGTMSTQNANAVAITGGGVNGISSFSTTGNASVGNGSAISNLFANGIASGANGGSSFYVLNGGTGVVAMGNKSAILGGAYSATPLIYSNGSMEVYVGGVVATFTSTGIVAPTVAANTSNQGFTWNDGTYAGTLCASAIGGTALFSTTNHPIALGTNNAERMRIHASGNVSIGNTTDNEKLSVTGNIRVSGEYRIAATKVVGARVTGWAAATGTATRTTFATSTVTTAQLAERVKALIDDLTTHGLIGT